MKKILEILLSVLGLICMTLGFIGMVNRTQDTEKEKEVIINYEKNGTKINLLTEEESFSLYNFTTPIEKVKSISGHGELKVIYSKKENGFNFSLKLKEEQIYTEDNLVLYDAYIFQNSIIIYLNKLDDTNYGKLLIIQNGRIINNLDKIEYNGNIYYLSGLNTEFNIKDNTFSFVASSISNGMFNKINNTIEVCRANDEEVYEALFEINYYNKVITSPTMSSDGRKIIEDYKKEHSC